MQMIDAAAATGTMIAFDQHTRLHGFTYLHAALPPQAFEGDRHDLRRRLRDPAERARMSTYRGLLGDAWSRVVLLDNDVWSDYSRRDIATIASERGVTPIEAVYDLLLAGVDQLDRLMVIILTYTEQQQLEVFRHPLCIPASDATALCPDGLLGDSVFHGAYTWAAWYYRFVVRDHELLSPEEAVYRLTGMPAATIGLSDRGRIARGMHADIAVFDPRVFAERGTTFDPNQLAVGMRHVLVNGVLALRDGVATGERSGRVLRRT
jgi:N-acyl-D-amino-acid deacylase